MSKPLSFQQIILTLQNYWTSRGCTLWQPYNHQVGAGTMNPATALRTDYAHFTALTVRDAVLSEIEQVMLRYVQFVLERKVKSVEFLNLLRRESAD